MKMFHCLFPVAMNSAALAGRGVYLNILSLKVTSLPVIYPFANYELRVKAKQPIIKLLLLRCNRYVFFLLWCHLFFYVRTFIVCFLTVI